MLFHDQILFLKFWGPPKFFFSSGGPFFLPWPQFRPCMFQNKTQAIQREPYSSKRTKNSQKVYLTSRTLFCFHGSGSRKANPDPQQCTGLVLGYVFRKPDSIERNNTMPWAKMKTIDLYKRCDVNWRDARLKIYQDPSGYSTMTRSKSCTKTRFSDPDPHWIRILKSQTPDIDPHFVPDPQIFSTFFWT